MKVAYVNIKLIIENWESGTWSWFLVPYLSKRLGYFKIVDRDKGTGNQLLVPYFLMWVYTTNVSKVQI